MKQKTKSKSLFPLVTILVFFVFASLAKAAWADPKAICQETGLPCRNAEDVLITVLNYSLAIFTLLGVIGFIVSGIMFITSGGSTSRATTARMVLVNSIIGIIVGLSGYIIISTINAILKGTILPV